MPTITTFLTFVDRAEQAVKLYVSVFERSKIVATTHYREGAPLPAGTVMTIEFELLGQRYLALNGGPHFEFTDAMSLAVECDTQDEIDSYSEQLIAGGGAQGPCGWVKDRFGVSWQINPRSLGAMLADPNPDKAKRAMRAMLSMRKLDLAALRRAFDG